MNCIFSLVSPNGLIVKIALSLNSCNSFKLIVLLFCLFFFFSSLIVYFPSKKLNSYVDKQKLEFWQIYLIFCLLASDLSNFS